jgi:restriction system protein
VVWVWVRLWVWGSWGASLTIDVERALRAGALPSALNALIASDKAGHIDTVVFNGLVDTTDPSNGQRIRPCAITVRATGESFSQLDLTYIEPLACLRYLSAGVSRSPSELVPARPVLEFNMVDARFVAEAMPCPSLTSAPISVQ